MKGAAKSLKSAKMNHFHRLKNCRQTVFIGNNCFVQNTPISVSQILLLKATLPLWKESLKCTNRIKQSFVFQNDLFPKIVSKSMKKHVISVQKNGLKDIFE